MPEPTPAELFKPGPGRPPGTRVAVLGDVSGWFAPLWEALTCLGMDPQTLRLPADLTVIQVGDLIHKGPDSDDIVAVVDAIMMANPDRRWVQLVGNHEAQHLLGGPGFWPCHCGPQTVETLNRWWEPAAGQGVPRAELAVGVLLDEGAQGREATSPYGWRELSPAARQVLVTHAGLGPGYLATIGAAATVPHAPVSVVAEQITRWGHADPEAGFAPGRMLSDYPSRRQPGVCWAEPVTEVCVPWAKEAAFSHTAMPWHQVHGHASTYRWSRQSPDPRLPDDLRGAIRADPEARHTAVPVAGRWVIGIDPGFTTALPGRLTPLLLPGDVTAPQKKR